MLRHPLFLFLTGLLIVIGILHFLGTVFSWYWTFWWFDIPAHLLGGFWAGGITAWLLFYLGFFRAQKLSWVNVFRISFAATIIIGGAWELFELAVGATFVAHGQYWGDTIADLSVDLAGALLAALYIRNRGFFVKLPHTASVA